MGTKRELGKVRRITPEERAKRQQAAYDKSIKEEQERKEKIANTVVVEVRTIERTERLYTVQIDVRDVSSYRDSVEEAVKVTAKAMVCGGEITQFTEGNADIESVTSVEIRKDN